MTVPGTWYGYPSKLPVITSEPGWLYVRLAQRPTGSTIWVRQSDVTLSTTTYAIVVNLTTMHLQVYDNGAQIFDFPAGIGAPDDPTPPGQYFVPMQYPSRVPATGPSCSSRRTTPTPSPTGRTPVTPSSGSMARSRPKTTR